MIYYLNEKDISDDAVDYGDFITDNGCVNDEDDC